ncbi:FAST kinase domain-containing protein 3, mitochondrial [Varanus komodoensis]|uniref:FAST kinase domains 3 n=1 Tax=Varanus komodoensis TaxID=61221 RepID=A0A8D2J8J1_VARKO|nr:FAST kinase domain-containing protein 3, mitochondrial [Varanus komodoensis]XP_044298898.1 FAST kinase domain-containing protein 3, mitochondrial [Varanus komodoensis]XP_044298899.1 FAST kinase domain-containing protein 3, mitochondrial [Varanus komodoensis]
MAPINFPYFQACASGVRTCRQLLARNGALKPISLQIQQLGSCRCGSSAWWAVRSGNRFQHVFCKNYYVELRSSPSSVTERVQIQGTDVGDSRCTEEQIILKKLYSYSSYQDIFKLVHSLESFSDTMVATAFQRVCDIQLENSTLKNPQEVVENDTFQSLCFQLEQETQNLSDASLVNSLNALIKLRVDPCSTLIARLVSESQERLDRGQMSIRDLCVLGEGIFSLEGPSSIILERVTERIHSTEVKDWKADEMAMVYRILCLAVEQKDKFQDLLNSMHYFTIRQVPQFDGRLTSTVLNSLVALDQAQALPLVIKLCKHSVRHVPHFTDGELVNVLEAFIHFGHHDQFFTEALERHVSKHAFTMSPNAVSKVMQYCHKKHILSKPIFDAVAESFVYNADNFTTSQIAEQIVPFGKLNYLPPCAASLFRKLERILSAQFDQFQLHTLLNLLHACTLIQRYPLNFLAKVFSPYFLQQLQAEAPSLEKLTLSQLTQLFLTVKLECPSYMGPLLLPKYRVRSFLTPGHALESLADPRLYYRVRAGLIDLLGAQMYFASQVLTPFCYTLDVEIRFDEEGFILPAKRFEEVSKRLALCIDDRKRFCANSHNLLGREAFKQRQLRLLGYEVVQIPFYEFEPLSGRSEIVKYLHKKIFPNSYRLSW